MDEIIFDFPENIEEIDWASAYIEFLVNRAANFNKDKYKYFIIDKIKETKIDYVYYHVLSIVSVVTQTPIYISKKIKKMSWNKDLTYSTIPTNFFKLLYLKLKGKGLQFSLKTLNDQNKSNKPQIFLGFTTKTIEEIAKKLCAYRSKHGC